MISCISSRDNTFVRARLKLRLRWLARGGSPLPLTKGALETFDRRLWCALIRSSLTSLNYMICSTISISLKYYSRQRAITRSRLFIFKQRQRQEFGSICWRNCLIDEVVGNFYSTRSALFPYSVMSLTGSSGCSCSVVAAVGNGATRSCLISLALLLLLLGLKRTLNSSFMTILSRAP